MQYQPYNKILCTWGRKRTKNALWPDTERSPGSTVTWKMDNRVYKILLERRVGIIPIYNLICLNLHKKLYPWYISFKPRECTIFMEDCITGPHSPSLPAATLLPQPHCEWNVLFQLLTWPTWLVLINEIWVNFASLWVFCLQLQW